MYMFICLVYNTVSYKSRLKPWYKPDKVKLIPRLIFYSGYSYKLLCQKKTLLIDLLHILRPKIIVLVYKLIFKTPGLDYMVHHKVHSVNGA